MAFENDAPANKLPKARFVRASRFPGSAQDRARFLLMREMACCASASLMGFFWIEVYASMAWVSASIPVVAVSLGGNDAVSFGSRKAICGTKR